MSEDLNPAPVDPNPAPPQDPNPAPPTPAARPDFLPEKFWNPTDGKPNLEGLAKSYGELEKRLSSMRPYAVPETPDAYELKPENLPDGVEWNQESAAKFAGIFHANGVSAEAAKAISAAFLEQEVANQAAITAAYEKQLQEGTDALKKEWGPEYGQKLGKIQSVVAALGYDHKDPTLFANPKIVSFLGRVVGMLNEDSVASMRGAVAPGNSFASGTEEANAIMTNPKHPDHEAYIAGDKTIVAKVRRLIDG